MNNVRSLPDFGVVKAYVSLILSAKIEVQFLSLFQIGKSGFSQIVKNITGFREKARFSPPKTSTFENRQGGEACPT